MVMIYSQQNKKKKHLKKKKERKNKIGGKAADHLFLMIIFPK